MISLVYFLESEEKLLEPEKSIFAVTMLIEYGM
jgi:hypothetical protein